jgi:hypothetical protein
MTFLAPGFFLASLAVAAAVVALHFIVTRQPRAGVLPTARFVPDLPSTATARATRPSDLLLMLLRVLLVLAMGAGLARPIFKPSRSASARVILADASRNVGDFAALRDSVRRYYRDGDAIVVFDSSARVIEGMASDSLNAINTSKASGKFSAGLIAVFRAASALRDNADSLELVVVSPFAASEIDAATDSIRSLWPGRARIVRAGLSEFTSLPASEPVQLRAPASDPLAISVARLGIAGATNARILRAAPSADDVAWVGAGQRALIEWPVNDRPRGAISRERVNTVGGVVSDESLVVAAFPRKWIYPADSIRGGEVVARWVDGEPAAVEWPEATGCVRSVSVPVNPVGDLPLSTSFVRFTAAMVRTCSGNVPYAAASQAELAALAGRGGLAPRDEFQPRDDVRSTLAPWLLGLALLAAVAELFVRRRRSEAMATSAVRESRMGRAA